ncbi:MAG: hypothetical protein KAG61_02580, partial [Bacteriovoracaceae bacterium]|nr:hypothetical protein [Bacteriovoracaceae bacterium]
SNIAFFNEIKEGISPLATTVRLSAQVTHHRDIRLLDKFMDGDWEQFQKKSDTYPDVRSGFHHKDASRFLLDKQQPWQEHILEMAKQSGWNREQISADKRFEIIRRPNE